VGACQIPKKSEAAADFLQQSPARSQLEVEDDADLWVSGISGSRCGTELSAKGKRGKRWSHCFARPAQERAHRPTEKKQVRERAGWLLGCRKGEAERAKSQREKGKRNSLLFLFS
jgi:hypothetical protein